MTRIPLSGQHSLLLFAPLLVPLLLAVPCLGAECLMLTPILLTSASSLDPGGHAAFCAWALGPLPAAAAIFALGLLAHRWASRACPEGIGRTVVWAMFTVAAVPVAWYLIVLVTSIGTSETPPMKYLGITALMTLASVILGQPLILLWLSLVDGYWKARGRRAA